MHINTPLIRSLPISDSVGTNVWLKFDALQPSGSFKLRGMGHKARIAKQNGAKKFVSSSGGNAGLAVAYAGMELSTAVTVYVPVTTKSETIEKLALCGAEVVVTGNHWAQAHEEALKELDNEGSVYFHPFDDELIWTGHSTLIDEVVKAGVEPDLVVCSVGGGGLLCGLKEGLINNNLNHTHVLGMETVGADSFYQSSISNQHIQLPEMTSRASSLGAVRVCDQAYRYLSDPTVHSDIVSDDDAEQACVALLRDHRVKVELACGAAMSAAYQHHGLIEKSNNVLMVVCGGVNE